jgi:Zn-dependent protease
MEFQERLQAMTIQIVPFFAAIVFHEFGHGWMAKKWGDRTATDAGRLTLNPLAHVDPIGTLAIPMLNMITGFPLFFGWAKPVPINPNRFRKYRPGLFMVSLAGPFTNVLLAFVCALGLVALVRFGSPELPLREPLVEMLKVAVQINFMLAFFNLIPIPPLDGAKIVESVASHQVSQMMARLERWSFLILLGLLWFNLLAFLETPVVTMSNLAITVAARIFGLS